LVQVGVDLGAPASRPALEDVIVYRIGSVRERLCASDRASEHPGEDPEGVEHSLLTGSEDAHEDRLSACARHGSISTPDVAVHHRRTDGLLSGPVGRFHVLAVGKEEERVPVAPQVCGQAPDWNRS